MTDVLISIPGTFYAPFVGLLMVWMICISTALHPRLSDARNGTYVTVFRGCQASHQVAVFVVAAANVFR